MKMIILLMLLNHSEGIVFCKKFEPLIYQSASRWNVPPCLIDAIMKKESNCDENIKNGLYGEIGLMQVLPSTGRSLGFEEKELKDVENNIEAGAKYLNLLNTIATIYEIPLEERMRYIISGYNAGEDVIYNRNIPNENYVREVEKYLQMCILTSPKPPDVLLVIRLKEFTYDPPLSRGKEVKIRIVVKNEGEREIRNPTAVFSFPTNIFEVESGERMGGYKVLRVKSVDTLHSGEMCVFEADVRIRMIESRMKFKMRIEGEAGWHISFPFKSQHPFLDPTGYPAFEITFE